VAFGIVKVWGKWSKFGAKTAAPGSASRDLHIRIAGLYKLLYTLSVNNLKPVRFQGNALEELRGFPVAARREAGYQLDQVQRGLEPDDWKPMNIVGSGVREIRIRDETGIFRVLYVAKLGEAVYVLHCFQKKTEKTNQADVDLAATRYRDLVKELNL